MVDPNLSQVSGRHNPDSVATVVWVRERRNGGGRTNKEHLESLLRPLVQPDWAFNLRALLNCGHERMKSFESLSVMERYSYEASNTFFHFATIPISDHPKQEFQRLPYRSSKLHVLNNF